MKTISIIAALTAAVLAGNAQAHHVWIEQDDKQARLFFGEFNLNLREPSPGLLDKLSAPTASLVNSTERKTLVLQKTALAYLIDAHAAAGESIIAEEANYPAYDKTVDGKSVRAIYRPAARYISDFKAQRPQLTLDVVPTGSPDELKVYFQDKALARAKVIIAAASGWTREVSSNESGVFKVSLPWQGTYAIEVSHVDATPGMRGADSYALATYATTLSVVQSTGLVAPPPPLAPNKMKE